MDHDKNNALAMCHAFTGTDITSSFNMKGKQTAWNVYPLLSSHLDDETLAIFERYVVILYSRTCDLQTVDEARLHL